MESKLIIELKNLTKKYSGVVALDHVNLQVHEGDIHAIVGENGAGKSTLIKTISGAIEPNEGEIIIENESFASLSPLEAKKHGISVIYQEFNLVEELSVYENIFLGDFISRGILINKKVMQKKATELLESLGICLDHNMLIKNLSVGYQQMVEIAKAVSKKSKILIMDEPSAPLTNNEIDAMFVLIRKLKEKGVTIIYISHRMEEIFEIADKVTVLCDGRWVDTLSVSETNQDDLIRQMIGRDLPDTFPKRKDFTGEDVILSAKNITGNGLNNICFSLKKGEILGFGGLVGSGRTEVVEMIAGIKKIDSGEIIFKGKNYCPKSPRQAISKGISLVPEDRKRHGVLSNMSVLDNISLPVINDASYFTIVDSKKIESMAKSYTSALKIKAHNLNQKIKTLSGGNQQKVVLAKWLATTPEIIIFDEPTRGIDVGAKFEIYHLMNELIANGKTLIMISSEMPELIGMSDRIIVLCEGKITGELNKDNFSQEKILQLASKLIDTNNM